MIFLFLGINVLVGILISIFIIILVEQGFDRDISSSHSILFGLGVLIGLLKGILEVVYYYVLSRQ